MVWKKIWLWMMAHSATCIIEMYTWNLYNFINQSYPNKLKIKKKYVRSVHVSAQNLPVAFYLNQYKSWNLLKMESTPPWLYHPCFSGLLSLLLCLVHYAQCTQYPQLPSSLPDRLLYCALCLKWSSLRQLVSVSLSSVTSMQNWNIIKEAFPNHLI